MVERALRCRQVYIPIVVLVLCLTIHEEIVTLRSEATYTVKTIIHYNLAAYF